MISLSRTYNLFFPLRHLNKRAIITVVATYAIFLSLNQIIPVVAGWARFHFCAYDAYCWDISTEVNAESSHYGHDSVDMFSNVDNFMDFIIVAVPILPISISCVVSMVIIHCKPCKAKSKTTVKHRASLSIITFTIVYIVFNIPVFIVYLLFIISLSKNSYPQPYFNNYVAKFYAWNVADVLSVSMNSAINPVVYWTRITQFRAFIIYTLTNRRATPQSPSHMLQFSPRARASTSLTIG